MPALVVAISLPCTRSVLAAGVDLARAGQQVKDGNYQAAYDLKAPFDRPYIDNAALHAGGRYAQFTPIIEKAKSAGTLGKLRIMAFIVSCTGMEILKTGWAELSGLT